MLFAPLHAVFDFGHVDPEPIEPVFEVFRQVGNAGEIHLRRRAGFGFRVGLRFLDIFGLVAFAADPHQGDEFCLLLFIHAVHKRAQFRFCAFDFTGHQHNFEKNLLKCAWSPDGEMISAGSSDRFVYIWDTTSRRIMYKLPGHLGSVNDIDFHKVEPISKSFKRGNAISISNFVICFFSVLSAGSDKQIYLGEFEP